VENPLITAVGPEQILRELADLWVSLGKEQSTGVLRACAMTLIVAVDSAADAAAASETLAELMHEHPSRSIVLKLEERAAELLESRVFAQCWMPFGGRQQICCEQIEIAFSCDRLAGVTPIILGITVPDLPVVLWLRSGRLLDLEPFEDQLRLAGKLIIDSSSLGSPAAALPQVQALKNERRRVADLVWARLTRWRQLVANAFEQRNRREQLRHAERVIILHAEPQPPAAAYYLAAWLQSTVGQQWSRDVLFRPVEGSGDCIRGIEVTGQGWQASLHLADSSAIVDFDGTETRVSVASLSECDLMHEELGILERDIVFERSLAGALRLAKGAQ
jgi:glucose-6-phosphate dehydrogenase assembly protein OpcA